MAKLILIHGYGSAIKYSIFKNYNRNNLAFAGFDLQLKSGEAKLFEWFIAQKWNLLQVLNPFSHINIYREEKKKVYQEQTLEDLHLFLRHEKPETIICHSMGALLLNNYLKKYHFEDTIKRIVLIQADIPKNTLFPKLDVPLFNIYCPWDPTLFISLMINHYLPAGLFGLKCASKNIFLPLWGAFILHIASIGNQKTAKLINSFEKDL